MNFRYHHEDTDTYEEKFLGDRDKLDKIFALFGNPFSEPEGNLMNFLCRVFASEQASIRTAEDLGKKQCYAFKVDRLVNQTKSLCILILLNKFPLFS